MVLGANALSSVHLLAGRRSPYSAIRLVTRQLDPTAPDADTAIVELATQAVDELRGCDDRHGLFLAMHRGSPSPVIRGLGYAGE